MPDLLGGIEARKPARPKPKRKARRVNHRARASCVIDESGKAHTYLNCAIPHRVPPGVKISKAVCAECGSAYSHLIYSPAKACDECRLQRAAEIAKRLELAGIPLGWGYCGRDAGTMHADWMRAEAESMGWNPRPHHRYQTRR